MYQAKEEAKLQDLYLVTLRSGPFSHENFSPSEDLLKFLSNECKVLVVGAGGLGCELLKDLALSGFRNIEVIDLDVVDVTNLNRQFLFRQQDVGKPKAEVAAAFIAKRIKDINIKGHYANIYDQSREFYRQFNLVVAGLDSIDARRWLNETLIDLVETDEDGTIDVSTVIPLIDGGTEGFRGQARVIIPKMSACFECNLDLFPPQVSYPLCTIANTPRLPEHCIEYASVILWPQLQPFGVGTKVDGDNPEHVKWIFERAQERANQFHIQGVTYRLSQGVIKHIIPAVASTNAIVAASCANEAFKLATYIANPLNNYMLYNGESGVYTYAFENERREGCPACGRAQPKKICVSPKWTLADLIEVLREDTELRVKSPSLTVSSRALYYSSPASLEQATKENLTQHLDCLLEEGCEVFLTDPALPLGRKLQIFFHKCSKKNK
ncbi:hypothetical protein GpartN1_g6240.t1 [Galdieria partita]|uniref:NEDD8-activating enzyme E1 catalytic subunit n=1 Tax=Galdieria partita TaxID=83374 RepID=A0A9C7Q266_9RHOD|nr:hypothetical protein GpartN1_g6240.t1 [Galdieria partita]